MLFRILIVLNQLLIVGGDLFLGSHVCSPSFRSRARSHARDRLYSDLMIKLDSYPYLPLYDKKFVVNIVGRKINERIKNEGD